MNCRAFPFRNERIGCLLDAIVGELVSSIQRCDQAFTERRLQTLQDHVIGLFRNDSQVGEIESISHTCCQREDELGLRSQLLNPAKHEGDHVVRDLHGFERCNVPLPVSALDVERNCLFLNQSSQSLEQKERIASGFGVDQLGKRECLGILVTQSVGYQLVDGTLCKAAEYQQINSRPFLSQCFNGQRQRMRCIHFVVSVCPNHKDI